MSRRARAAAVLLTVLALTAAGCTGQDADDNAVDPPSPTATPSGSPPPPQPGFKACLLLIGDRFEDAALSQAAAEGLLRAERELGIKSAAVEADAEARYSDDLAALVKSGCDAISTVSYLLGDATRAAAAKNPEVDFSIVDFAYDRPPENLKGSLFESASPAFLAGYLAAGVSETGVVGTFGGAQIPSVTVYMDGFRAGVERYNDDNDTEVELLGWDGETETGTFTNDFESQALGRSVAAEMITQGADIVFPVAGAAGLGALQAVQDAGVRAVWADTDGCVSAAEYCDVLLTSVTKGIDVAVYESVKASLDGSFDNATFVGTLENGGVGLAPYHQQQDAVPAELEAELDELEQQIVDGELEVD